MARAHVLEVSPSPEVVGEYKGALSLAALCLGDDPRLNRSLVPVHTQTSACTTKTDSPRDDRTRTKRRKREREIEKVQKKRLRQRKGEKERES